MNPHIYNPHADDVVEPVGDKAEELADALIQKVAEKGGDVSKVDRPSLLLAIAKDETEIWRGHLAGLVELWDAMGVMGIVCAKQERVTEFLAKLHDVKSIMKR